MKTGFVYIWYDRKRKMYYIGCHWGTEQDGYICSSVRMKNAYKKRPLDFKRRIIQRNISRNELYQEEFKWLSKIKPEELKIKYYNICNHKFNGHTGRNLSLNHKQKISNWHKLHPDHNKNPERNKKISIAHKGKKLTQEHIELMRKQRLGIKNGRGFEWKIRGPDGSIYIEKGLNLFAKKMGFEANNLRVRGHSNGFVLLEKN